MCNYTQSGICSTYLGCEENFCQDHGIVPSYSLMKKNTFKNYVQRVPLEYQEKNFKLLQKKLGLSKTDDNCKIRFCKNCEDPYQ